VRRLDHLRANVGEFQRIGDLMRREMTVPALEALIPACSSRYIAAGVRRIVVILALQGLLPGLGPVALASASVPPRGEPTVNAVSTPGDEHSNSEHGCGVTLHLCGCCAAQPVLVSAVAADLGELAPAPRVTSGEERQLAPRTPDRPFRPPIR
jgi:hypothetical protein